jgi:SRSO17 transposase
VHTTEDQTVAAGHSVDPARWQADLEELLGRVAARFGRVEPRRRARAFVLGLLADLPRKNCWTLAEHAGDASPDGMQHLLARAAWDHDGVRDDVRAYVVEHLGDPGAVLVVDETGDLKKGTATVGVQRQYTGTAGRVENAQVAVLLVYASQAGHAVIDRELYLPRSWTRDPERRRAAGAPAQVGFTTKPALAQAMLIRALEAGIPAAWVTGDEVYGADPRLRACLEARGIGYVLAVACDHPVVAGGDPHRADALLRRVPARAWQCVSAGTGAKGHRYYDWAFLRLDPSSPAHGGQHWLMIRRNRTTGELAYYRCFMPRPRAPGRAGHRGGPALEHQGAHQDQQGPGRPGRSPGPPLAFLVPPGHPGHARPRLPGGRGPDQQHPPPTTPRADRADLQRTPAPSRRAARPPRR